MKSTVVQALSEPEGWFVEWFRVSDVLEAAKSIKHIKTAGQDIYGEHFIHSHECITLCCFWCHDYSDLLSEQIINATIVPLVKGKKGDLIDIEN